MGRYFSTHRRIAILIFVGLCFLCVREVPAPIFGIFDGLDELIKESDSIVVAKIRVTPYERRASASSEDDPLGLDLPFPNLLGYEDYEVTIMRVIKGELVAATDCVVGIRNLPLGCSRPGGTTAALSGLNPGSLHFLFLKKSAPFWPYEPLGKPAVAFSVNCEGAHFPLAADTNLFADTQGSPKELITKIVNDSSGRFEEGDQRRRAKMFARKFLREAPGQECCGRPVEATSPRADGVPVKEQNPQRIEDP